ncbi:MAG: PP2C family protein-serine/threonine phosphatase [Phycisphaerales bacterium]
MKTLDLSAEEMLSPLLAMLRELTRADMSREALTRFTVGYGRHRPVERFVAVRPAPETPGGFRIIFDMSLDEMSVDSFRPSRDRTGAEIAALPVRSGGFIGTLLADPRPKLVMNLAIQDDPHLSEGCKRLGSCMALPVFRGEEVEEWVLGFSSRREGYSSRDVIQGVLVSNMLGVANRQIDTVNEVSRLNAQMRDQFDQIARLQQALLPNRIPRIPGLEIATSYLSSDQAGGDYYDFFHLGEFKLGIMIADVSGHGAAAATVMAMLHAIVHCYEPDGDFAPDEALNFANRRLVAAGLDGQFVTAFLGVIDTRTGDLTYSNAGHPPPIVKREGPGSSVEVVNGDATLPLGILDDLGAPREHYTLGPLDTLLLYTDGITEAFNTAREMYGVERLRRSLVDCTGAPDCALDHLHKGLFSHRGNFTRDDDQTIVAVRYHGVCELPVR